MKWAVYHPARGWLIDTCAGGDWSWNVDEAVWFDSENAAKEEMSSSDIDFSGGVVYPRVK